MNIRRGRLTAAMTLVVSLLGLAAAFAGVWNENLYKEVYLAGTISEFLIAGSIAQDLVSIPLGLLLAVLSVAFLKRPGYKTFIAILGLTGYFFYGYGLYTMQGQYTAIYLVYLAIFGLSLYSLIWGITSFDADAVKNYFLPRSLRLATGVFLAAIVLVLTPIWFNLITADIEKRAPGDTYAVFILDLAVVFPALGIIAALLWQNNRFGNILAGVALFKAMTVCLSVAFGEWFNPYYSGHEPDLAGIAIFAGLTLVSLVFIVLYLLKLEKAGSR